MKHAGPRAPAKAAGGKAGVLPQLLPLLPPRERVTGYREPFVGGGAMFWAQYAGVRPAMLGDNNVRLMDCYVGIRDAVEDVIDELRALPYHEDVFYAVRERFNRERTTAFGRYDNPTICDAVNLRACSRALRGVDLRAADFEETLATVRPGEFVFADPTYIPLPGKPSFTAYTAQRMTSTAGAAQAGLFGATRTDHERLAACLRRIDAAGAYFVATNSDTEEARRVYAGWPVATIRAKRAINSDGAGRGEVTELVFSNCGRWR